MRATALGSVAGSAALLLCLLASASPAQDVSRRAPVVRVVSQDGGGVASHYVTPAVQVSEDAYVFAVMMDLDGRIQVLHPEFPGISVRIRSNRQHSLPNFFAGYNAAMYGSARYASGLSSYDRYDALGNDTRGTVIAIASRAPFNLESIDVNGDWDMTEIRRLIEYRSPLQAANALAQRLGTRGEPIGHDYMRFAGRRQEYYAYDNLSSYCGYSYGYGSMNVALSIAHALRREGNLPSARYRPVVIGYDTCGLPIVVAAPLSPGVRIPPPPREPGDTTIFPKSRIPAGIPRYPGSAGTATAPPSVPMGVFPLPTNAESEPSRVIPVPDRRRVEPREVSDGYRSQPASTLPARPSPPVERAAPPRAEPASGTMQPTHRAEPRVIERTEPVRAPERIREAPAPPPIPVVHERPAPPPPPPPPPPREQPSSPPSVEPAAPPPGQQ